MAELRPSLASPRRWLFVAGIAVFAVVATFANSDGDGDGDGDGGGSGRPRDLVGYRILYDVRVHLPTGEESSRREVSVRRPFAGADLSFGNDEDRPTSGMIADGSRLYTILQDKALDSGELPPGPPPGDYRFAEVLDDLKRLDLLDERGDERIAGRDCTVYRSGAPLGDPLRSPSAAEFVDWCLDGDGLLLHERWFLGGELLRETTAVTIETEPPGAQAFEVGLSSAPNPTGFATREELPIDRRPDVGEFPYYVAMAKSEGFTLESRWRSATTSNATGAPQVRDVAFVDVYRRDIDVVLVAHRERSIAGEQSAGYDQVPVPPLGVGQVFLSERGAELRFEVDHWVLSVRGTLPVADLVDFSAGLAPIGP